MATEPVDLERVHGLISAERRRRGRGLAPVSKHVAAGGVDLEDVDDLEEEAEGDEAHNEDGEHNGDDGDERASAASGRADARSK